MKTLSKLIFIHLIFIVFIMPTQSAKAGETYSVNLIWQAHTITPAQYTGKPLPTNNSIIDVQAIGNSNFNPSQYIFDWYINKSLQESHSGLGKNYFTFSAPQHGNSVEIKVVIKRRNQTIISKQIDIPIVQPKAVIISQQLNGNKIKTQPGQTIELAAAPYYFNGNLFALEYNWEINQQKKQTGASITLKIPDVKLENNLTTILKLTITNNQKMQTAVKLIHININNLHAHE